MEFLSYLVSDRIAYNSGAIATLPDETRMRSPHRFSRGACDRRPQRNSTRSRISSGSSNSQIKTNPFTISPIDRLFLRQKAIPV